MRAATLLLCALLSSTSVRAQRPKLSSGAAAKAASQDESLGSQLLSSVLSNDVQQAEAIFGSVAAAQSMRLANAIDWRGKSVLMHAASRDHAEMVALLVRHNARVEATDYTGGMTALMLAARNGSLAAVEALVTAGANVNAATPHGTTTLMNAVASGSLPAIGALVKAGAEVNAKDKSGASALSLAANTGVVDVVRMLLLAEANIDAADLQGATPLLVASAAAQLDALKTLLEHKADPNAKDAEGMVPLMEAARNPSPLGFDIMTALVGAGANVGAASEAGLTSLAIAAGAGNGPGVALLLQNGADVNELHGDGTTALIAACENGSLPIVTALLQVGASPNLQRTDGLTATMAAASQSEPGLVQALLAAGGDANAKDTRGVTACHMAAEIGAVDVVQQLVAAGADCTVMAESAITPLIVAAAAGEAAMVDLLISLSNDVDDLHPDKSAMTALMAAASNGSIAIIDKLLAGGAQVNKRNSDGVTALMHAAVLAHAHIVEGLLERGADLHARDNDGFDALVAAATGGTAEVCRLLLGKGLDPNIMAGSGGSPLMIAARAGATEAVKVLLDAGAAVDAVGQPSEAFVAEIQGLQAQSEQGLTEHEAESRRQRLEAYFEEGSTALMYAAALGHHDVVTLLVQAGADARVQDRDQQSALVHAANSGSVQSVQLLLEQASADAKDKTVHGLPLLVHAIASGQEQLANLLVQHGASVDAVDGGSPPLLLACQAGSLKLLQALIQKGAQLTAASEEGVTPLMVLAASGSVGGIKLVTDALKDEPQLLASVVGATTENHTTALHMAARQAHVRAVGALLAAGASVAPIDLSGQTPLGAAFDGLQAVAKYVEEALQEYAGSTDRKLGNDMLARAAAAHIEVMEMLLAKGAEPSLIDNNGGTVDAHNIVETYKALARGGDEAAPVHDEL